MSTCPGPCVMLCQAQDCGHTLLLSDLLPLSTESSHRRQESTADDSEQPPPHLEVPHSVAGSVLEPGFTAAVEALQAAGHLHTPQAKRGRPDASLVGCPLVFVSLVSLCLLLLSCCVFVSSSFCLVFSLSLCLPPPPLSLSPSLFALSLSLFCSLSLLLHVSPTLSLLSHCGNLTVFFVFSRYYGTLYSTASRCVA